MTTVQEIKLFMKIEGKQKTIGSGGDNNIKYSADYDLQEYITSLDNSIDYKNHILALFQSKFAHAKKSTNIFIIDFKAGIDPKTNLSLRWTYDDLIKSSITIDGRDFKFQDILTQKSTIKLDVIAIINKKFTEFSENYYFHIGNSKTYEKRMTLNQILKSFLIDVKKLSHEGNFYKALKRLLSYYKISKTNEKERTILQNFFNSSSGKNYKIISDLEIIIIVMTQKFKICPIKKIKEGLQHIDMDLDKIIKLKTRKGVFNAISKMIVKMKLLLMEDTKVFINNNKFLEKYIKIK
jgi:hypothetical protein